VTDTIGVSFEVKGVERLRGCGALIACAVVEVEIAGVPIVLQGVTVRRLANGQLLCQAPKFRDPRTGNWCAAVILPETLRDAIGAEVISAFEEEAA
jgi:stage V sporulation protein G